LVEEGIDMALRMGDLKSSAVPARRIGRSQRLVLGTCSYFERAGEPATPADLLGHRAVVYAQGGAVETWIFRKGKTGETINLRESVRD
jgi:hypothetical protein